MRLICPGCGMTASAEVWLNDPLCRETLAAVASLPQPMPQAALSYLSLFRPEQKSLTWKKALRLTKELAGLVGSGYVQVRGKVDRSCPPKIWALAIEDMVERRGGLKLPMEGHVYLSKVAHDLAEKMDAKLEQGRTENARAGNMRSSNPLAKLMEFEE